VNSEAKLGVPKTPLSQPFLEKIISCFGALDNIKRAYHYGQTKGNEFSLVLGFELARSSENGKRP
jgi:hypothetical protein